MKKRLLKVFVRLKLEKIWKMLDEVWDIQYATYYYPSLLINGNIMRLGRDWNSAMLVSKPLALFTLKGIGKEESTMTESGSTGFAFLLLGHTQ